MKLIVFLRRLNGIELFGLHLLSLFAGLWAGGPSAAFTFHSGSVPFLHFSSVARSSLVAPAKSAALNCLSLKINEGN